MPDIRSIRIPLPPLAEQDGIVDAAWSRFTKLDRLVIAAERQIGLLEERRQALITAAVTGELAIPERVPQRAMLRMPLGDPDDINVLDELSASREENGDEISGAGYGAG